MDLDTLTDSEWVRAAIRAQMVMCQALSDEELDELSVATAAPEDVGVATPRAA